jgi:ferredoxin-NADP reductase
MLNNSTMLPVSLLAFLTTAHIAIFLVRRHRTPAGAVQWTLAPSVAFFGTPWIFPSIEEVTAAFAAHLCWFGVCEFLTRGARRSADTSSPAKRSASAPRQVATARSGSSARTSASSGTAAAKGFVPLSVLAVIDETPTIRTFRLRRPDGVNFVPGQFLTVQVHIDGQPHIRCYSVSSAPDVVGYIDISVKRQGLVSGSLHSTIRPGSVINAKSPAGSFVYPSADDRPIVLVAGGVGITPVMSMLRHATRCEPTRPVTLLYAARGADEFAYRDELAMIARTHPQVRTVLTSSSGTATTGIRSGRIDAALIRECVATPPGAVYLMCGPAEMIAAVEQALVAMGVPPAQVRYEVFQPTKAIGAAGAAPGTAVGGRAAGAAAEIELTLAQSHKCVAIDSRQSLLEGAESAGVEVQSLCRSGVCGTCRTRLVSGEARCTSDALDEDERADGWVLPCVTWASEDCTLDA